MMAPLYVLGCSALVGRASLDAWPDGPNLALEKPDLTLLERSLRRGLSDVTRLFMHVAYGALRDAQALERKPQVVFGSAFGEIATAEAMFAQAYDESSTSPVRFRHSVHNTAEGLYSISVQNREPATAIAAGWETVAMGLLEASCELAAGAEDVLLVFAEEEVPLSLSAEHQHGALAAAFYLTSAPREATRATLSDLARGRPVANVNPFGAENHPLGPAAFLARTIEGRHHARIPVSDGNDPYHVTVTPGGP